MIHSFLSLNLAFSVVVFVSTLFLFIGIFYSRKKVSLNTYLVSNRNVGVFNLSATLIASSLGAWILFGPPTAATWGGLGSVIGYALGAAFPMIALIFFGKKLRVLLPKGRSLTELVLKRFGKKLFKLIFFFNDLLFIHIFMRRSHCDLKTNLLYFRSRCLDFCNHYLIFYFNLCFIWWVKSNY